jgi:leucyl-tRNA synthetase
VLAGYGTGAIMAVPAGDERDFKFAQYFNITITNIFSNYDLANGACTSKEISLTNSDFLNNLKGEEAIQTALKAIEAKKIGAQKIIYRFRDAGFSRQRYWGEPFPIVYQNGVTKLTRELPVILPAVDTYSPGPNGKGPLANLTEWVTSSEGERETDTMPGYAGSSWYFLRYMDPKNTQTFASKEATSYWNQVDVYVGGAEHAVGHLLYSRMWTKALYDLGYINFDEPFKKVINQGMIQGSSRLVYREKGTNHFISAGLKDNFNTDPIHVDVNMVDDIFLDLEAFKNWRVDFANATFELEEGKYKCGLQIEKMSKRLFNVVNPDDIINQYGADTFRMYEMFLGPIDMSKPWDTKGIEGVARFLKKLWRLFYVDDSLLVTNEAATKEELKVLHKHIKKINYDMEQFAFNTSVSQFIIVTNELASLKCNKKEILEQLVITLAPFAPHMAEELYAALGNKVSVLDATFPTVNEAFLVEDNFNYTVAINGKARSEISLPTYTTAEEAEPLVLALEKVKQHLEGKPIKKFIFVKGKMINLVI